MEQGRPISDPVGDAGLKVADSREIVVLALNSGVGSKPPTLVLGPLDQATIEASDALLKTLEDLTEAPLQIFLWADFLSGVRPTILSRTHPQWCPAPPGSPDLLGHLREDALSLCAALLVGDPVGILAALKRAEDRESLVESLLSCLAEEVQEGEDPVPSLRVWEDLRPVLSDAKNLLTVCDALLPAED